MRRRIRVIDRERLRANAKGLGAIAMGKRLRRGCRKGICTLATRFCTRLREDGADEIT
ncbi:MAG: hypothetical protein ACXW2I_08485 [Burkholderiales bacterium]